MAADPMPLAMGARWVLALPLKLRLVRLRAKKQFEERLQGKMNEMVAAVARGDVVLDDEKAEFWRQGRLDLSTEGALRERMILESHPKVRAMLDEWWATALMIEDWDDDERIGPECHAKLLHNVYKALLDDYDHADAIVSIADDWRKDAGGAKRLTYRRFIDAIYELADVWTPKIDVRRSHAPTSITDPCLPHAHMHMHVHTRFHYLSTC